MKCIQFGHSHAVDRSQDRLFVDVVSTRVQNDPAIGILWTVHNVHFTSYLNLISQVIENDQLTKGLYGVSSSEVCGCRDIDFYLKFILANNNYGCLKNIEDTNFLIFLYGFKSPKIENGNNLQNKIYHLSIVQKF